MKGRLLGITLVAGLLALTLVGQGYAATLSFNATCDDAFVMYLSTTSGTVGTQIGSGASWGTTYSGSGTLNNVAVQYLQVDGYDLFGPPSAFIGDFTLDDTNFWFANNTQSLVTNATEWTVSPTGFNDSPGTPADLGANGVSPWGTRTGISTSAHWIWDSGTFGTYPEAYFEIPIYSHQNTPVPLPPAALLLGSGLIGLVGWRKFF